MQGKSKTAPFDKPDPKGMRHPPDRYASVKHFLFPSEKDPTLAEAAGHAP